MKTYLEVRWHGRGGQGTVTGAKTLAEAILNVGKYIQAFPEYGPERRGAPVRVYNRFSDNPIRMHTPVKNPDVIIVVDPTLVGTADLTGGAKEDAIFLINTTDDAQKMRKKLALKPSQKLYIIPATKISVEEIGRALPNVPMLGGFTKAVPLIGIEELLKEIRLSFEGKFPEKIIEGNLAATRRGYEEANSDV
jgi:pyruvate ferredoxin oxidoreductase gamma subunit